MNAGPIIDKHVFLVGRPPLSEFLSVVKSKARFDKEPELGPLAEEWRKANDHIIKLEKQESGIADSPPLGAIPESLSDLMAAVENDPLYAKSFEVVRPNINMVELDKLVVFQKHINLTYVEAIKKDLGNKPDEAKIFRLCLPFEHPKPPLTNGRISNNAYTFVSPSTDVRFLDSVLLDESQISGYQSTGPISNVLGLVVGFGSNFLNAIHSNDRLVLNNGSHRAYALRDIGVTHVPCIVQQVSRKDELDVIASGDFKDNADRYLKGSRPPLLKDYFDPELLKILPVQRTNRQVRIVFQIEMVDLPAM